MARVDCASPPVVRHAGQPAPHRGFAGFFARFRRRIMVWQADFRRARALAQIRRAIGDDDHLLRDIGFTRSGDRVEPVDPDRRGA